jgi:small subunit ribosomal protein S21
LTRVDLRPNESQQQLLRRFRKKVSRSGKMSAIRKKRWFVSKSEVRRLQRKKAIRRQKQLRRKRQSPRGKLQ